MSIGFDECNLIISRVNFLSRGYDFYQILSSTIFYRNGHTWSRDIVNMIFTPILKKHLLKKFYREKERSNPFQTKFMTDHKIGESDQSV